MTLKIFVIAIIMALLLMAFLITIKAKFFDKEWEIENE
jgi:hypothetical protein